MNASLLWRQIEVRPGTAGSSINRTQLATLAKMGVENRTTAAVQLRLQFEPHDHRT